MKGEFIIAGFDGNWTVEPQKSAVYGRIRATSVVLAALPLAACAPAKPVLILPPASLATCADAPAVPETLPPQGTKERDNATLAIWLAEREAGTDCRSRVAGLRAWMEKAK